MRIAIYHNVPSGGAKRTLYDIVKRLSAKHVIDVYTLSSAEHHFGDIRPFVNTYQVFDFEPGHLLHSPFGRLNQAIRTYDLWRLRQLSQNIAGDIDRRRYDIVLVYPCQFTNCPSLLQFLQNRNIFIGHEVLRRIYEKPGELDTQYSGPKPNPRRRLRAALDRIDPLPGLFQRTLTEEERRNLAHANLILVNSKFTQAKFQSIYGVPTHVCYHGVDEQLFQPLGLRREGYIISVGALRPDKGFAFLIQSLALIPPEHRPALKIAANYAEQAEHSLLVQLSKKFQVDLTIYLQISDESLVKLYNQAMLTVYAPYQEPFGLCPVESMACGTPVVAVNEGGIRETVVNGETGLLLERDAEAFAAAINGLMEDPIRLADYSKRSRQAVLDHWTWEQAIERLESFLN